MRRTFVALLLLLASPAVAAERSWPVMSGGAVGPSHLALQFQAGWPGLSLAGLYGVNDKLDAGLSLAFAYGADGSLGFGPGLVPGFRLQPTVRYALVDTGAIRLGAWFAPGFGMDYLPGVPTPRILLPLGLTVGIVPSEALAFHVGLDLPVSVTPGTFGGLTFPILVGGGVEYHVDRALALTAQMRIGPAIELTRPGAPAHLALEILGGLAYRI
ncbi:MAG TPA: hypothetical protein VFA20_09035 [Myxococcaceae bacterium]|nr:hypothetical protein [Myxococcaceae bacterium]